MSAPDTSSSEHSGPSSGEAANPRRPAKAQPGKDTDTTNAGRKQKKRHGEPPHERRGISILALVALILSLVALAGVGMLSWSWYQVRGEQARVTRLADRVSALAGQTTALKTTKADAKSLDALAEQLHDNHRAVRQRLADLDKSLRKLTAHLAGASTAYRVDEAMTLMRLAQARLSLASDPAGAARALTLTRKTLAATTSPAFAPVQLALQREIAALKDVPRVDTGHVYIQLETLADKVGDLPLAGQAVAKPSTPATAAGSGFSWSHLGAAFQRAFSPLVVVRHGPVARPLLPPDEAYFVHQNMRLTLAEAQLALLQHDAPAWQASLKRARTWLGTLYLTSDSDVEQARETLAKLSSIKVAPELPALGGALAKLTALRTQRGSAVTAPNAATGASPQ